MADGRVDRVGWRGRKRSGDQDHLIRDIIVFSTRPLREPSPGAVLDLCEIADDSPRHVHPALRQRIVFVFARFLLEARMPVHGDFGESIPLDKIPQRLSSADEPETVVSQTSRRIAGDLHGVFGVITFEKELKRLGRRRG